MRIAIAAALTSVLCISTACTASANNQAGNHLSVSPSARPSSPTTTTGSPSSRFHPTTYPPVRPATGSPSVQHTQAPIPINQVGRFAGNVTGKIVAIRSIHAAAKLPGEIAGPALAITIKIINGSAKSIDLANAVVNLLYGSPKTPGGPMSASPSSPFTKSVAAGAAIEAVYVFTVPAACQDSLLTIQVSYSPFAPIVVFQGRAAAVR